MGREPVPPLQGVMRENGRVTGQGALNEGWTLLRWRWARRAGKTQRGRETGDGGDAVATVPGVVLTLPRGDCALRLKAGDL